MEDWFSFVKLHIICYVKSSSFRSLPTMVLTISSDTFDTSKSLNIEKSLSNPSRCNRYTKTNLSGEHVKHLGQMGKLMNTFNM